MRRSWIAGAALLAACGTSTGAIETDAQVTPTPVPTVAGVGSLPETIPATLPAATDPSVVATQPVTADGVEAVPIGERVGGNRLLMIGDSILASTEDRFGGEMCAGLVPLGWAVEVAAEEGRFAEFGVRVLDRTVPATFAEVQDVAEVPAPAPPGDWDAAAVFLGSNYAGDQDEYDATMRVILDRLAPRPTLLFTVTEFREDYEEVAAVIDGLAADYPNVTLIDWADAAEIADLLQGDGLHPTDDGELVLVGLTAAALGPAPAGQPECLRSTFRDDSAR